MPSDCIPIVGSNVGARSWDSWWRASGSAGEGQASSRTGCPERSLISVGFGCRGHPRGDDGKRTLRHSISGEVRRFWKAQRAGLPHAPDHDHHGLPSGGKEEPPATVFSHKRASVLSKTWAFTPLASQQWVAVALAYIKELEGSQKTNSDTRQCM